ncbi:MAG: DNA starvation/stationary phase protection protein [Tannerellaceae bacterium]|jgi:starvation-inducible DNA-binding protein|nr:DNA starvation/stationary phase protection protein [Tannerellaceae bacterium]
MKTLDFIHLDASKTSKVIAGYQQLLADYQLLYANLRGFHWNIEGHNFFVLHSKFEELYNDAASKIDEIAERIMMLGGKPVNALSKYLEVSRVKEVSGVSCCDEAAKSILDAFSVIIEEERSLIIAASEAKDEATGSMISDYLKEQEKTVWMLVAFLTADCKK